MRGTHLASVALAGLLLVGCNDPTYLTEYRSLQTMADPMGGFASDTDTFTIPIRPPLPGESAQLQQEQMQKMLPMPVPWVGVRDLPVEIEFTLKNLDSMPGTAFFVLNGGNEFGSYDPSAFVNPLDPNAVAPPPLAGNTPIHLAPGASQTGTFREDDIAEAAIDLEAITRYPGPGDMTIPFKVLNNRSDVSKTGLEMVPPNDVTPQQIHFTFVLSADAHVQADYVVRVRNLTDRLAPPGMTNLYP